MNRYVVFSLIIETITADFFAFGEKICLPCIEQVTVGTDERHLSKKRKPIAQFVLSYFIKYLQIRCKKLEIIHFRGKLS